ncbi:protein of unknown function [Thiomonas sp. OC7]|nr:protein of unknown function [Thiomonas sp. OC7]
MTNDCAITRDTLLTFALAPRYNKFGFVELLNDASPFQVAPFIEEYVLEHPEFCAEK